MAFTLFSTFLYVKWLWKMRRIIFITRVVCCVSPYVVEYKQFPFPLVGVGECEMKAKEPILFQAGFRLASANSGTGRGVACSLIWCAVLRETCIIRWTRQVTGADVFFHIVLTWTKVLSWMHVNNDESLHLIAIEIIWCYTGDACCWAWKSSER